MSCKSLPGTPIVLFAHKADQDYIEPLRPNTTLVRAFSPIISLCLLLARLVSALVPAMVLSIEISTAKYFIYRPAPCSCRGSQNLLMTCICTPASTKSTHVKICTTPHTLILKVRQVSPNLLLPIRPIVSTASVVPFPSDHLMKKTTGTP
jgi:hypothetical protein